MSSGYEPLSGKAALVTGASRGIGAAIASELARQGARVAITYLKSEDRAREVVSRIAAEGGTAVAFQADSSTADGARNGVQSTVEEFGLIDILVNNAGAGFTEPFTEASLERIEGVVNLNLWGTLITSRAAIDHMPDGGRIIMIGSTGGQMSSFPGRSIYGATKAALKGFTQGLSRDLGPREITVNLVQPGPIETELSYNFKSFVEYAQTRTALGRFGQPSDVAFLVAWLASYQANFVTGATINIDGGFTA